MGKILSTLAPTIFNCIVFILADNDNHNISDDFEFRIGSHRNVPLSVFKNPQGLMMGKVVSSHIVCYFVLNLFHNYRTAIKSLTSLKFGQIPLQIQE